MVSESSFWRIIEVFTYKKQDNTNIIQTTGNELEEYVQELDDGSKLNVSGELQKTKYLDGLEISNIQLKENGGITTLLADINNKSGADVRNKKIKVEILDKEGKVITTLKELIEKIPSNEKIQLNMAVTADVANAYDFRISNYEK